MKSKGLILKFGQLVEYYLRKKENIHEKYEDYVH